eukprot:TRINITY_DN950_c0_g1_i3.p1 TRINITY_DN950_c0_g1~~TRINITY_DN950_c0_g1_i3.p1  ORF type:complete len:326 (-),score=96.47 TRINITY_DN950_c0_g1_i3:109-954(-)
MEGCTPVCEDEYEFLYGSGDGSGEGDGHCRVVMKVERGAVRSEDDLRSFVPLKEWLERMSRNKDLSLRSICVQSVDYFGARIGFMKFVAEVYRVSTGERLPGITFLRGGAVSILFVLCCGGVEYVLLISQARVPGGYEKFLEIPAGMLDGSSDHVGVAVKEVEEEVGIIVEREGLFDMTEAIYGSCFPGVFPSVGGCDEYLRLFLNYQHVDEHKLHEIQSKSGGGVEGEDIIHVHVVSLCEAHKETPDAQTLCALYFYEKLKESGALDNLITCCGSKGSKR